MNATKNSPKSFENLAAELSDRAFRVAAHHGMRGNSVDLELNLWQEFGRQLQRSKKGTGTPTSDSVHAPAESCLAALADTAYQVALKQGFEGSFLDLRLDLWSDFRSLAGRTGKATTAPVSHTRY